MVPEEAIAHYRGAISLFRILELFLFTRPAQSSLP